MPLRVARGTSRLPDWYCGVCDLEGGAVPSSVRVTVAHLPGLDRPGVSVVCPGCGAIECFNTELTAEDEDATAPGNHAARAEQARLVRAVCRVAGLAVRG